MKRYAILLALAFFALPFSAFAAPAGRGFTEPVKAEFFADQCCDNYSEGKAFRQKVGEQTLESIAFEYNEQPPVAAAPDAYWSARFTGKLNVPAEGEYTFTLDPLDDGARLYVDGVKILDAWRLLARQGSGTVSLKAGVHELRVEYFNAPCCGAYMELQWQSAFFQRERITLEPLRAALLTPIKEGAVGITVAGDETPLSLIIAGGVGPFTVDIAYGDGESGHLESADRRIAFTHAFRHDGTQTVEATVKDSRGKTAAAKLEVSIGPLPAPRVIVPVPGRTASLSTVVAGRALPDTEILIYRNGRVIARTRSDASGWFEVRAPLHIFKNTLTVSAKRGPVEQFASPITLNYTTPFLWYGLSGATLLAALFLGIRFLRRRPRSGRRGEVIEELVDVDLEKGINLLRDHFEGQEITVAKRPRTPARKRLEG